jgi:hypothetical protein
VGPGGGAAAAGEVSTVICPETRSATQRITVGIRRPQLAAAPGPSVCGKALRRAIPTPPDANGRNLRVGLPDWYGGKP